MLRPEMKEDSILERTQRQVLIESEIMSETETETEREETHESIKDIDDDLQVLEISTTEEEMMIDIEKDRVQRSDHTQKKE